MPKGDKIIQVEKTNKSDTSKKIVVSKENKDLARWNVTSDHIQKAKENLQQEMNDAKAILENMNQNSAAYELSAFLNKTKQISLLDRTIKVLDDVEQKSTKGILIENILESTMNKALKDNNDEKYAKAINAIGETMDATAKVEKVVDKGKGKEKYTNSFSTQFSEKLVYQNQEVIQAVTNIAATKVFNQPRTDTQETRNITEGPSTDETTPALSMYEFSNKIGNAIGGIKRVQTLNNAEQNYYQKLIRHLEKFQQTVVDFPYERDEEAVSTSWENFKNEVIPANMSFIDGARTKVIERLEPYIAPFLKNTSVFDQLNIGEQAPSSTAPDSSTSVKEQQEPNTVAAKDLLNALKKIEDIHKIRIKLGRKLTGFSQIKLFNEKDTKECQELKDILVKVQDAFSVLADDLNDKNKKAVLADWQQFKGKEVENTAIQHSWKVTVREIDPLIQASLAEN